MGNYRDDPDAVSLRTTPEDAYTYAGDDDDAPEISTPPPTYDEDGERERPMVDAPGAVEDHFLPSTTSPESHFAHTSRRIGAKRATIANEVNSQQDALSDTDAAYLKRWITKISRSAPSPYIHITGTHSEMQNDRNGKKSRHQVTDFRIMVSMRNYLWPQFVENYTEMQLMTAENGEKTYRGTILKARAPGAKQDIEVGDSKPGLDEWCHRYCANSSGTRMFRVERTVTGMNEEIFHDRLRGLIRSTNYKGHLSIEFPVADRAVDIYSTGLLNNWRMKTWICWIFYLTFLWIFSWPILLMTTKKYHVVRAEWPFSKTDAQGNRRYTTVSEEQWIDKFGPAIKQLCLDRYEGLAGDTYLNQVLTRPETHQPATADFRNGQAAVNAAIGAFRGGPLNAAGQVSTLMRFTGVHNDAVGWGFDT